MGTFRLTLGIDAPAAHVFTFVADPRNMPRWYDAVQRVVEVAPETPSRSAIYEITRALPGGPVENVVDVTESAKDLTVTFESLRGPTPFCYRYRVEPDGVRCLLTLEANISSEGLPGALARLDAIATRAFKAGMQHNLTALKKLVESDAPKVHMRGDLR
jgi:uncharacterized membrane protein